MRLRAVDLFEVLAIEEVPSAWAESVPPAAAPQPAARDLIAMLDALSAEQSLGELLDALLDSACALTASSHSMVFLREPDRPALTLMGSRGYQDTGVGAEVQFGELLIGQAALSGATVKVSDLSRIERLGRAAGGTVPSGDRVLPLPHLSGSLSQIAVPIKRQGKLQGVLFVEAQERLAFDETAAAGLEALARQAAQNLPAAVQQREDVQETSGAPFEATQNIPQSGPKLLVRVHRFDDSVFINDQYVIKGVAGRLLAWMVHRACDEGRRQFTNREIRLDRGLRLPDFKDNLETRLLLLSRRLDDRGFPIRLRRTQRGLMELMVEGRLVVEPQTSATDREKTFSGRRTER